MADKPDLVIPVRFDVDKAIAQLGKMGLAGKQAGSDVKKGMEDGKKGADTFRDSVAGLMKAQMSLAAAKQVAQAIGDEFHRAADRVQTMAKEFTALRQAMQQVAALKGESNSNKFTLNEVKSAAAARLMPQEWKSFQEQFQSYGGAYLEGDQARFKDNASGSAGQQAQKYQQQIAEFAKARGISADEAAQLGGGLLQFSEGPQTTEGLISRFGKVFRAPELSATPVSHLLPEMTRVMAQGASPEEAAQLLGLMSEAMPGKEETGILNTLKAITSARLEDNGEEFGQKAGMTPLEKIEAAARQERESRGKGLNRVPHEYFPDLSEIQNTKGLITRGLQASGFGHAAGYVASTPNDFAENSLKDYETSDTGIHTGLDGNEAIAEAETSAKNQSLLQAFQTARFRVTNSAKLDKLSLEPLRRPLTDFVGMHEAKEQFADAEAIQDLRKRTSAANEGGKVELGTAFISQLEVNQEIKRLLEKIASAPLSAPPPGGNGARQGGP